MIKSKNPRAITTHESTICAKPFRNLFNIYLALFAALLSIASFSAQAADPVVNTVPWVPANRLIPHETWSGKEITLKAAADVQGGSYSYTWDFGDSSPVVTGTVTDRFVIDARHTYVGTPGDVFTARLTVENTSTGETGSDTYFVQVREKTLETEVNVAIDEGLWYLHRWQTRTTEGGVDYGDWRARSGCSACSTWFAITAANINAFAAQGHPAAGAADNPYTETVQRAMRRLVTYLRTESISNRTYPDIGTVSPDSNGNGLGVRVNQTLYPYQGGLFMDAIIAAGEPDTVASTGPAGISGRSYADIVQDMVDSYAFGQYNLGSNRGGWRYSWNQGPDNSAAQWGAIGLIPAERLWGLTVPEWVKSQNAVWLAFSQTTTGTEAGRFGYTTTNPSSWGPYAVTPSGMVQMVMDGMGRGDNRWDLSETWIRDRFANTCTSSNLRTCARTAIKDYYYGLFSFVKSMRLHEPAIEILQSQTSGVAPIDWYAAELSAGDPTDGVARTLVNDQQANGAWIGNYYESRQQPFNTPWAIIMLGQTLFEAGSPVAVGQATPNPGIAGQSISLNGTGSFHQDPERTIVGWEWDLDNDGAFETLGVSVATSFPVLGDFPVNLRVTDDSTPPRTAETTVIVRITIPPLPPTADAGGPYSFCPNQSWFLDGTGSINPDEGQSEPGAPGDTIQQYAWDLDGDGSFDDALGSQTDVTGYFGALGVGDYLVNLQVTDTTSTSFPSSSQPDLTDAGAAQVRVRDAADAACTCISDLTARPKSGQVQLVWTDTGATSYNVYRGTTAGGPYQFLATTDSRYSTYLDRTVENGTQYFFVVRETSPNGAERCQSIEATATPNSRRSANNAPVVVSTPPTAAVAQMLYRYDVDAVDADGEVVTYSLDLAPAGMTIDAASGLIEWTPVQAQVGTQNVTVRVSDPAGAADTQAWQILVSDINAPPAIVSSPVVDATEGQLYSYDVDAIDPNAGDTLTYSLDVAPAGMTMDPASGLIEWTPGAAQIGPNAVTVRVTDAGSLFDTQTYTIDVVSANNPPAITSTPVVTGTEGQLYSYDVEAIDSDAGDTLTFSLDVAPAGMGIDAASGLIEWTPAGTQLGDNAVTVRADDGNGGIATQSYTIAVSAPPNQAPSITSTPVVDATEAVLYTYDVEATDPDSGDVLTFSLDLAPAGMSIDATSGLIQWTPAGTQLGDNAVTVRADDGNGGIATQSYTIAVSAPPNQAPSITSTPVVDATEAELYTYDVEATDPDSGDTLTFSLDLAPAGMTIDPASGLIQWTPADTQLGGNAVTVRADDGNGGIATQSYTITVSAPPNQAPSITSTPVVVATEAVLYTYDVEATDPDAGDSPTFSLDVAPTGMTIDAASGLIQWTPADTQLGGNAVTVRADDGNGGIATQSYTITVSAAANQAPSITSVPGTNATDGLLYTYDVEATDPDAGDTLTFSLDLAPAGMTINATSGLIQWTPAGTQLGDNPVTVRAADGNGGFATQSYTIAVSAPANQAPSITSTPGTTATEGQLYTYDVEATDPDAGDTLTFSLDLAPSGMNIDPASGLVQWTPAGTQLGDNAVTVRVADGNGGLATQSYTIAVSAPANQAPSITSTPGTTATEGLLYTYDVEATDPDAGDTLTFSLDLAPAGMSIDPVSGLVQWTPNGTQLGDNAVTVRVADGNGAFATQSYTISVAADNAITDPLDVIISVTPQVPAPNEPIVIQITPIGGSGTITVTATLDGAPLSLINGQATVPGLATGRYELAVTVADESDSFVETVFITVSDPADADIPIAEILSNLDNTITAPVSVVGTATDSNLADYRLLYSRRGANAFTELVRGEVGVITGVLGELDPTALQNGTYDLVLEVRDLNGNVATDSVVFDVDGDFKVGEFSFTVTDLVVPMIGIPISINRTYDTRRRQESLDFGFGWTIDYQSMTVQENQTLGLNWQTTSTGGFFPTFCIEPVGSHFVTVVRPDGKIDKFNMQLSNNCSTLVPPTFVNFSFEAAVGTDSTLVAEEPNELRVSGGNTLLEQGLFTPFDPSVYTLTTKDGLSYRIQQGAGIQFVEDRGGNRITYTANGIVHSAGKSILFQRDGSGRITQVIDPEGNSIGYEYDSVGNLRRVHDREGNTTRHTYNRDHALIDIFDPLGRRITRSIYDDDGRLIAIEDGDGNLTQVDADANSGFKQITDALGNVTQIQYDVDGNPVVEIDATGNQTVRVFDAVGNLLSETDPQGNTRTFTYDAANNRLSETDPLGNTTTRTYDAFGNVLTETDPAGNTTQFAYDLYGNKIGEVNAAGVGSIATTDANGSLQSVTDSLGNITVYERDGFGQATAEIGPAGTRLEFTFDQNGNQTQELVVVDDGMGGTRTLTIQREFDGNGNLTQLTDPEGYIKTFAYDASGNLVSEVDANGNPTAHEYDAYGRRTRTTHPDGSQETRFYNPLGWLLSSTDRLARTTTYQYDANGRVTGITYPDGNSVSRSYDANGRVTSQTDEVGNTTAFEYDADGNLTAETDPLGNRTEYSYDAAGNRVATTDSLGRVTTNVYDAGNRLVVERFADGAETQRAYDLQNLLSSETDRNGNTTNYAHDALARLTEVTNALGNTTRYEYNDYGLFGARSYTEERGAMTAIVDALGRRTEIVADGNARPVSITRPDGSTETFEYDGNGNLIRHVDRSGRVTLSTYNGLDQLTGRTFADGSSITYEYEGDMLSRVTDSASGVTSYQYDLRDRLLRVDYPDGQFVSYAYDAAGRRTQVLTANGNTNQTYDAAGRLTTVSDSAAGITSYQYNAAGELVRTDHANGTYTLHEYDLLGRITAVRHFDAANQLLSEVVYTLDAEGNRLAETRPGGIVTTHTYDSLHQLVSTGIVDPTGTVGAQSFAYTYDAVGNRISSVSNGTNNNFVYNALDQIVSDDNSLYRYDADGNLIEVDTGGVLQQFTYNARNQLVAFTEAATTEQYAYDHQGLRVAKITNGIERRYLFDEGVENAQILESSTIGSGLRQRIVYGYERIAADDGAQVRIYHHDGLGSTEALSDAGGAVTDRYQYSPLGDFLLRTGGTENLFYFAGEQLDETTGQYYLRARYYNIAQGRFTQADPFDGVELIPLTLHDYEYALNNFTVVTDPSGQIVDLFLRGQAASRYATLFSRLRAVLRGLQRGSVKQLRSLKRTKRGIWRDATRHDEIHHVIEKRTLTRLGIKNVDDTPGIVLPKEIHQQITTAFLRALPRRGMRGYKPTLSAEEVLAAAQKVYPQFGEAGRIMLNETLKYLSILL